MAGEQNNGHDSSRLDRIEGMIEVLVNEHMDFAREHRQLLTAQVLLTDRIDRLTERLDRLAVRVDQVTSDVGRINERAPYFDDRLRQIDDRLDRVAGQLGEIAEAQKRTDEKLKALIITVDKIVGNPPRQAS